MVIARGTSPGNAAAKTIDRLELHSDKATIVAIPLEREGEFERYQDQLLDEKVAAELLISLDIKTVRT